MGAEPFSDAGVGFAGGGVEVEEEGFEELLLDDNLVSIDVERITRNVEHLRPQHSLKFKVLISRREKRLPLQRLSRMHLIKHRIVDQLSQNSLILA